jgi:hypothetical protein
VTAAGGPDADQGAGEADALVCMNDGVEVDPSDPRCMHPSSRCRFREECPVAERVRASKRRARARPRRHAEDTDGRA